MSDAPKLTAAAVAKLSERLALSARDLAPRLLPGGQERGGWWCAQPRRDGGPGDSLKVNLTTGKWTYFGADPPAMLEGETFGDMLDLIRLTQHVDKAEARARALRYLGLDKSAIDSRRTPEEEREQRRQAALRQEERREKIAAKRKKWANIWYACPPVALDNPAGLYLAWRIPGFASLMEMGWGLSALRFHPALNHPYAENRAFPALLAWCQFDNGKRAGIHRYYLIERGRGEWDVLRHKIEGLDGKLSSNDLEGGFIPLWRGVTDRETGELTEGLPWRDEGCAQQNGGEVVGCEGIENALSLAAIQPGRRYFASVSLWNFTQIRLPAWVRRVVWFQDDDGTNDRTPAQLDAALARLEDQGCEVLLGRPPEGFKDANDVLRERPKEQPQEGPRP